MSRPLRRAGLTLHVLSSVGWFGAVLVFLGLALAGTASPDERLVRAAYVAMAWAGNWVLVPLAVATLVTGIIEGLITQWGLVRHWWVVFKLALTLLATVVLLLYTRTLTALADAASNGGSIAPLRSPTVVVHTTGALVLLAAATVLGIYKPRGTTGLDARRRGGTARKGQMVSP